MEDFYGWIATGNTEIFCTNRDNMLQQIAA